MIKRDNKLILIKIQSIGSKSLKRKINTLIFHKLKIKKLLLLIMFTFLFSSQSILLANEIVLSLKTNGYWNLFTCDTNGNNLIQIKVTNKDFMRPRWSNDGKKIAYISGNNSGRYEIWIMNDDGSD